MNPAHNIEAIKYEQKERQALSYVDTEILIRSCTCIRDRAILAFLLATGCRVSELVGLDRDAVDLDRGECIVLGKGRKERTVYLDDVAVLTLREYLSTRADDEKAEFKSPTMSAGAADNSDESDLSNGGFDGLLKFSAR